MKKRIILFTLIGLFLLMLPIIACTENIISSDGEWEYSISESNQKVCTLVAYRGNDQDITIPSEIDNLFIIGIPRPEYFFYNGLNANSVSLSCEDSYKFWGSSSYTDSQVMTSEDEMWNYIVRIDPWPYVFEDPIRVYKPHIIIMSYNGDDEHISIPEKLHEKSYPVYSISTHVFSFIQAKSISFPDSILHISTEAFYKCPNLEIEIPSNIIELDNYAIIGCKKVTIDCKYQCSFQDIETLIRRHTLTTHAKVDATCIQTGIDAYWNCDVCGNLFSDSEGKNEITEPVIIPTKSHTFSTHDIVEPTCTEAGTEAYWTCDLCGKMFSDETGQTEIIEPIPIPALGHDWGEPSYEWSEDYNQITASHVCKRDETHIETETVLTESVTKPATYSSAGRITYTANFENDAFKHQTKIVKIPKLPVDITVSGNKYHLIPKKKTATFTGVEKKNITSLTIPDTIKDNGITFKVTEIAANACKGLSKLTSVSIGSNVKTIGDNAFFKCSKVKKLSGGANVTTIGASAFEQCSALTEFTIFSKVKSIGAKAFFKCKKLAKIIVLTTKLTDKTLGANAFGNVSKVVTFKCPKKKMKAYQELFPKKGAPKKAKYEAY